MSIYQLTCFCLTDSTLEWNAGRALAQLRNLSTHGSAKQEPWLQFDTSIRRKRSKCIDNFSPKIISTKWWNNICFRHKNLSHSWPTRAKFHSDLRFESIKKLGNQFKLRVFWVWQIIIWTFLLLQKVTFERAKMLF